MKRCYCSGTTAHVSNSIETISIYACVSIEDGGGLDHCK